MFDKVVYYVSLEKDLRGEHEEEVLGDKVFKSITGAKNLMKDKMDSIMAKVDERDKSLTIVKWFSPKHAIIKLCGERYEFEIKEFKLIR